MLVITNLHTMQSQILEEGEYFLDLMHIFHDIIFYWNQYGHRENNCNMFKIRSNFLFRIPFMTLNNLKYFTYNKFCHIAKFGRSSPNKQNETSDNQFLKEETKIKSVWKPKVKIAEKNLCLWK